MSDVNALDALVAYAQEVVFGYEVTLREAPLGPNDRRTLTRFKTQSEFAAATLRSALEREGGKPLPAPDPATAPPAADPSRRGYLRDVITAEELLVGSYYNGLQSLSDKRHLSGAAAFMRQAGRRLVVLRHLVGEELLPRAFETGAA